MYITRIVVPGDAKLLAKLFAPEIQSHDRSSLNIKELKQGIAFIVKAQDATALRSTLHGITKLLQTYEALQKQNIQEKNDE